MATSKKMTPEERKALLKKRMEDSKRELEELEGAEFWQDNKELFTTFWKTKIKEENKDVTDFVLLGHFIKTIGIKGVEVRKKEAAPKKEKPQDGK